MNEVLDGLLQQMQELTATVKAHRADPATLDFEQAKQVFGAQIEALVAQQVEAAMERQPSRRIPGVPVGAGERGGGGLPSRNRYAQMVKDFAGSRATTRSEPGRRSRWTCGWRSTCCARGTR
jgi:hypothetical protein